MLIKYNKNKAENKNVVSFRTKLCQQDFVQPAHEKLTTGRMDVGTPVREFTQLGNALITQTVV